MPDTPKIITDYNNMLRLIGENYAELRDRNIKATAKAICEALDLPPERRVLVRTAFNTYSILCEDAIEKYDARRIASLIRFETSPDCDPYQEAAK